MAVFQLGVILTKILTTDVIVRVEAESEQEAQEKASKEIQKRIRNHPTSDCAFGLTGYSPDWTPTHEYDYEGISEEDYSDTSPGAYPEADIDLTQENK